MSTPHMLLPITHRPEGRPPVGPCGPDAADLDQASGWLCDLEDAGYTVAR